MYVFKLAVRLSVHTYQELKMKCPKCKYTSFDHNENCPKCTRDLTEIREKMNLPSYCPLIPTHTNFQDQGTEGSIKIEQTGDFTPEENMDMQFTDTEDFETSFDAPVKDGEEESDLDFALATDTNDLTLDFDEFSVDDSDGADMETIVADSLEEELDMSFADEASESTMDLDEIASDDAGQSTMDFEDLANEDSENVQQKTDSIESTEKEVSEITLDFEDSLTVEDEEEGKTTPKPEVLDLDLDLSDDNSA
jgi:hypothetical protein